MARTEILVHRREPRTWNFVADVPNPELLHVRAVIRACEVSGAF